MDQFPVLFEPRYEPRAAPRRRERGRQERPLVPRRRGLRGPHGPRLLRGQDANRHVRRDRGGALRPPVGPAGGPPARARRVVRARARRQSGPALRVGAGDGAALPGARRGRRAALAASARPRGPDRVGGAPRRRRGLPPAPRRRAPPRDGHRVEPHRLPAGLGPPPVSSHRVGRRRRGAPLGRPAREARTAGRARAAATAARLDDPPHERPRGATRRRARERRGRAGREGDPPQQRHRPE